MDNSEARFFDSRERYRMFVSTTTEKWQVAARIGRELDFIEPGNGALRVFDAGLGDGTVLDHVLKHMHLRFPHVPIVVVGKEISLEDVRQSITRLADRFVEHPELVIVLTNMLYKEAPTLMPSTAEKASALSFRQIALDGNSAFEFEQQIRGSYGDFREDWEVRTSPKTGNPLYDHPAVTVVYRKDREFMLSPLIPKRDEPVPGYQLVIASQPFRARTPAAVKVKNVIRPLARALAPRGRLVGVQSWGHDPGMEIVNAIWPDESPFQCKRHDLFEECRTQLNEDADADLQYLSQPDADALFNYRLHAIADALGDNIGTSFVMAAWNAAVYVAQMDDERIHDAMKSVDWQEAVENTLRRHSGLWFNDESFVITRTTGD